MVRYRHFFPFLSPSQKFSFRLKMSHNSKYYVKKLCKKYIKGQQKIGVFKKINKGNDQSSEIKSEVRQVLDYIITEVCNEVEIDNPSKTKEVSSPQALITHSETATAHANDSSILA